MKDAAKVQELYQTQWRAHFKRGYGQPAIVYGESQEEAMRNALAYFRKNDGMLDFRPIGLVVDYVEPINRY